MDATPKKCYVPNHKRKDPFRPSTCLGMIRKMKNSIEPKKVFIGFKEQAFRLLTQTRVTKEYLNAALEEAATKAEEYKIDKINEF